jgi:hypothetical protein
MTALIPAPTGTYAFNPAEDDFIAEAFSRIQIRGDEVDTQKIVDAERSANLLMVEWNNKGQNQFQLALAVIPLSGVTNVSTTGVIPGSAFGPATLQVFSAICITNSTPGNPYSGSSVPMIRLGRADYEQIPYKPNPGRPDRYFWDTSDLTIAGNYMQTWPMADNPSTYTIRAWTFQRIQDVGGLTNLSPVKYEWLEAFNAGLTARLAEKYQPSVFVEKKGLAELAWQQAVSGGRERGPTRFRVDARSATSWR